jgi:hypothetical protein
VCRLLLDLFELRLGQHLDRSPVAAPPAAHLDDVLGERLLVLHRQGSPDAVVVERSGPLVGDDVEACEVPAGAAAVAGEGHTTTLVAPSGRRLGNVLHAFVLIDAEPARIAPLAEALAETDGITEVFSVAGGVCDLVAIVRVRHHDDLAEVVTKRVAALEGIESTTTLVAFQAFSRHDLEAIWDIGPA